MTEAVEEKIKIGRGKVTQEGYPETFCRLIKTGGVRKDPVSDKLLYIVEGINLPEGMYAVTESVSEALGRVERKSIGIMQDNGVLAVPMINSSIVVINDKFIACNTSSSSKEIEAKKLDPIKVSDNAKISQDIKNQMKTEIGAELNLVCDDFYATYDIYEVNSQNELERVFGYASFISLNDDVVYAHTNDATDKMISFGKKIEPVSKSSRIPTILESDKVELPVSEEMPVAPEVDSVVTSKKIEMPVATFATVESKELDNLGDISGYEDIKPGAPELIAAEEEKDAVVNEETTPVVTDDSSNNLENSKEDEPINSSETSDTEVSIEPEREYVSPFVTPQEEKTISSSSFKSDDIKDSMSDIAELISAVKGKMDSSKQEIEDQKDVINKKEEELKQKDKKIESLEKQLRDSAREQEELRDKTTTQASTIERLNKEKEEQSKKITRLESSLQEVYSAFSSMIDSPEETTSYFKAA